jgi:16S rRNA (cytosine967-C5)-methyltransferase
MKLHRNLIEAVAGSLDVIFNQGKYADKVIEKTLASNKRWGARDRAFIAETTYEIVRWWRLLNYLIRTDDTTLDTAKAWKLIGAWELMNEREIPDWEEFDGLNAAHLWANLEKAEKIRKIRQSIPDWLDELGEAELGKDWGTEMAALNFQAPVILRTNTLKTNRRELQRLLADDSATLTDPLPGLPDALALQRRLNVFTSVHFKNGFFEIQDAASQMVAPFLEVEPGMRVIDACAGAGGKTLHLANLMDNKGRIVALDTEAWKLTELKKRALRNGVQNVETRVIENNKIIKRLHGSADRLLLDVPCSGLGVLRRNPDAKWKLDLDFLGRVREQQAEILRTYPQMLKPGGMMVYATCSILPSESEAQVQKFLEEQKDFELVAQQRISPAQTNYDGFYMARLVRKG